ncbi:MAG TPA: YeeE/YedE family protein [Rhodospirillales bacterium]|nr:YeeE/YedE family protein [Rhodospirillales bacterium]
MEEFPVVLVVSALGFCLGAAFGATAQKTSFCTMGAISDVVFMNEWNRFRAWMLAVAVAILGSQALHMTETVDLSQSIYLTSNFGWAGALIGGLLFGFGMTLTGGCGNKTLVRLGAGNLKSLVVAIFLGIFAYMTLRGLIGLARMEIEGLANIDLTAAGIDTQGIPDLIAASGLSQEIARFFAIAVVAGGLLWFCFKSAEFRRSKLDVAAGLVIGTLVPVAWFITGVLGRDDFEPVPLSSLTFVAPVGESLQYLMTFTGSTINFGIAVVGGVIAGSFVMAKASGQFRVESFIDSTDMVRHMIGGAIMGIGGVMALGCTIGQGIAGMSTLALGSLIALLSIITGGVVGMKYLEEGSLAGALSAMFPRGS